MPHLGKLLRASVPLLFLLHEGIAAGAVAPPPSGVLLRIGKAVAPKGDSPVSRVALSADGKTLAWAGFSASVQLWDVAANRPARRLDGHLAFVTAVAFSPNGKLLATGSLSPDNTVRLWDVDTGKARHLLRGHRSGVHALAFSPDGRTLASAGGGQDAARDNAIRLWEVSTGKEVRRLEGHRDRVLSVAFSPDGKALASGSWDWGAPVCLWDLTTGRETRRLSGQTGIWSVAFSPDGKRIATGGGWDGTVVTWDVDTGKFVRAYEHGRTPIRSVAFSPDGRTLAAASTDRPVCLWEVATGKERLVLGGESRLATSVVFSPDGRVVAIGRYDTTALLWDATGLKPGRLEAGELEGLWVDLLGPDAMRAYLAVGKLAAAPPLAVPFLRQRLLPDPHPDARKVARLLADLDNEEYTVREKASVTLARLGGGAVPALRKALAGKPSPEARRRIEELLKGIEGTDPPLRALRVTEVLERIASREARQLLEALIRDEAGRPLGAQAKASLERLSRRPGKAP